MRIDAPRVRAVRLLDEVMAGRGSLADHMDRAREGLSDRDGAFVQALVYGALRHGPRLQFWRDRLLDRPLRRRDAIIGTLILLGLHQIAHTRVPAHAAISESVETVRALRHPRAAGLVNALLRRFLREQEALEAAAETDPAARWMHPVWLVKRLAADWPDVHEGILAAGNGAPPLVLRVNRQRANRDTVLGALREAGHAARPGRDSEDAVWLEEAVPVERLPGFAEGCFSVQDESAQLVAGLLAPKPGERILDACAAPGGKAAHLLERAGGELDLLALDVDAARLQRIRENLDRLGLAATLAAGDARRPADWWDGHGFDAVLLDVPCSGTGVIRRHPDIKYLRRESDVAGLAELQSGILAAGWSLLAPGGRLLYTTCSVLREENQAVVRAFLDRHPEAVVDTPELPGGYEAGSGVQRLPAGGAGDGFYYARLRRPADA